MFGIDDALIGGAISAGASLLGGKMASDATAKNNRLQIIQATENRELQKQFAKEGIQWRVADARSAGIHPLAALGAQTSSFAPIQLGTTADTSMGNALASAGQDIGRAISATSTTSGRASQQAQQLQLTNMALQNDLLRAQIAKTAQQVGPPMPALHQRAVIPGQGDTNLVDLSPAKVTAVSPNAPSQEAGANPEVAFFRTGQGTYAVNPAANVKNAIDDDTWGTLAWNWRNRMQPIWGSNMSPPHGVKLRPGWSWVFNPLSQTYEQRNTRWYDDYSGSPSWGRNPAPNEGYGM